MKDLPQDYEELDESDKLALASGEMERLKYLKRDFWKWERQNSSSTELFCASIDLKQFYPKLRTEAIFTGLSFAGATDDDRMRQLLKGMLRFRLDKSDLSAEMLEHVEPSFAQKRVSGVPTGLFVAGFLANAAMLPIDCIVDKHINQRRSIAHFRFVDDHTILAYDFEELCEWIDRYQSLLKECSTGAEIHPEKYDPASLGDWMDARRKASQASKNLTPLRKQRHDAKRKVARGEARIDGKNPTELLTKTLGQVSAIAATNVDILDDKDLHDQLRLLEWLLLANIPEREIRPDTRAAFAAGRIATFAPILISEADGLVDAERSLSGLKAQMPNSKHATEVEVDSHNTAVEELRNHIVQLTLDHKQKEETHLRRYFGLLLQAFREFPGKSRLFFRIHQYCRVTGFKGLGQIGRWIDETHGEGHRVWANYYTGLSLQILARGMLISARTLSSANTLRSEQEAAVSHLEDISHLKTMSLILSQENEAWFQTIARREFGISLLSVAELIRQSPLYESLGADLESLASKCIGVTFCSASEEWEIETGRRPAVWAHLTESVFSFDGESSPAWNRYKQLFSLSYSSDALAARRYPENFADEWWEHILNSPEPLPETDSGWLRQVMEGHIIRATEARSSKRLAFLRAARSLEKPPKGWMTLMTWTRWVSQECSPFDPRRSEWTALEIVRQLVSPALDVDVDQSVLDRLHPSNILVPEFWKTRFPFDRARAGVSWEAWREAIQKQDNQAIKLRDTANSVLDYRYSTSVLGARSLDDWDRRLIGFGRILLGLLREDHQAPRIWNIRGNEQIFFLPRGQIFQSLAISSSTLVLLEGCLSSRSAETRAIAQWPSMFGWSDGREANDSEFDPPLLLGANELLSAIENAQQVLREHQLAVAFNHPRQLIPFRIRDFAVGSNDENEGGVLDE